MLSSRRFYKELGNLFYAIAAADKKISDKEKKALDEDDEEEVLEDIERRIKKSFNANKQEQKFKDFTVLPVSSSMALDGALQNNENILVQSGMPKAKEHLLRMVQEGSMADGWLCDSILNTTPYPSPMSIRPAFSSPAFTSIFLPSLGSVFSHLMEFL